MKTLVEHLSTYAEYHRDSRNILTHLFGVPIIVFAVIVLLSKPAFEIAGVTANPAMVGYVLALFFYFRLSFLFGVIMAVLMAAGIYAALAIAQMSTLIWALGGVGAFVVGWIIQFIGHYYEGKKPAFVDDLVGLLVGPIFIVAEVLFAMGLCQNLKAEIESRAGKVRHGSEQAASV
ncbi:MAG: DUF962 domain-containing protein [Alteromonadaceae bacterium]|nr:DUF962 domain-containing protein [Alteromonadaceae bacterium]